jgi:hypothetical protein
MKIDKPLKEKRGKKWKEKKAAVNFVIVRTFFLFVR